MNKFSCILASVAIALCGFSAWAQDSQMANHLSLGLTLGIDGVGAELVLPVSPYVQVRGGYSIFPYTEKRNVNIGTFTYNEKTLDMTNTPVSVTLWKGGEGKLLVDLFPGKETAFHFTVGAFMGSGKLVGSSVDMRGILDPADYKTSYGINNIKCSTDENGFIYMDATVLKVLPYVGIGAGRALKPNRRVGFTFDLGVAYTGGIKVTTYDFSRSTGAQSYVITSSDLVDENGKKTDNGLIDKAASFPVLPILRFGVYFLLF